MQCFRCQFENLPGLLRCGRCDAVLELGTTAANVSPPRAAERSWPRRIKFLLGSWCRSSVSVEYKEELREARNRSALFYPLLVRDRVLKNVLRAFIPGMAQAALGGRGWGTLLLGAWLLLFAAGAIVISPFWRWQFSGMSAAVRLVAAIDLAFRCSPEKDGCVGWGAIHGLLSFVAVDCLLWMLLLQITG